MKRLLDDKIERLKLKTVFETCLKTSKRQNYYDRVRDKIQGLYMTFYLTRLFTLWMTPTTDFMIDLVLDF